MKIHHICPTCLKVFHGKLKRRFCSHSCHGKSRIGDQNTNWHGGRELPRCDYGYRPVYAPDNPRAHRNHVFEHVLVAEKVLGFYLPAKAVVHHVNRNGADNSHSNLVICENQGYHRLLHARQRIAEAGGRPGIDKICSRCKLIKRRTEFSNTAFHGQLAPASICRACSIVVQRLRRKSVKLARSA